MREAWVVGEVQSPAEVELGPEAWVDFETLKVKVETPEELGRNPGGTQEGPRGKKCISRLREPAPLDTELSVQYMHT